MRLSTLLPTIFASLATATNILITIPPSPQIPHPSSLPPSTHATLTTLGALHKAPLRVDNMFSFRNVTPGSYLLDVHCHTHAFAPLRVDVHSAAFLQEGAGVKEVEAWGTFRGNEWNNKGEVVGVKSEGGKWEFDVRVLGGKEYFLERAGFSPLSLLKNPMILIAGFSMAIVFGMPYLMDNMDPEMRAEFEERQKSGPLGGGQSANALQNFDLAAMLAGAGSGSGTSTPKNKEKGVAR
ncbi:hypothetical protein B0J14DRAFT_597745 [Halenospora varia]|nr:hypothetical protein B0J14DRAFT_597745 [Halenospora varia]